MFDYIYYTGKYLSPLLVFFTIGVRKINLMMEYLAHYPSFFTATILEWKPLLKLDKYKEVITNSLAFLVKEKRV